MRFGDPIDVAARPLRSTRQLHQLADEVDTEAEIAGMPNEGEPVGGVRAIAPLSAFGPSRFKETAP